MNFDCVLIADHITVYLILDKNNVIVEKSGVLTLVFIVLTSTII